MHTHTLSGLNPRQQEAVTGLGKQLVLAGPGSGKTRVITEKILHLIRDAHARPDEVLALTFSEKAAREMQARIDRAGDLTAGCTVQTFHSFCFALLKDHPLESGLNLRNGLISRTNQIVWGQRTIDAFGFEAIEVGNNAAGVIESVMDGISSLRNELIAPVDLEAYLGTRPDDDLEACRLGDLLSVYRAYEAYKRDERLIDFDDMIHEAVALLERHPIVRDRLRAQYPYILVDEFQDTNYAQLALVKSLCNGHLCVVGDDDQTIYRFRGAYFGNVKDFTETYPDRSLTVLNQNYRNSGTILALAGELIDHTPDRPAKHLRTGNPAGEPVVVAECETEAAEAVYVADEIRRLLETTFSPRQEGAPRRYRCSDIAVLCRQRAQGQKVYRQLVNDGIPAEFVGEMEAFRFPAARDLIAALRVVDDPLNAGIPINRLLRRAGVSELTVQQINREARASADPETDTDGVYEVLLRHSDDDPAVREVADRLARFIEMKATLPVPDLVYTLMMESGGLYYAAIRGGAARERRVLDWLYRLATEYADLTREPTIADFLVYLDQVGELSVEMDEAPVEDAVRIMTIHQSKGTEFPVVFLLDLSEGRFPVRHRAKAFTVPRDLARSMVPEEDERELSLQEERRLCYVAMTRAEERLYLTRAVMYGQRKTAAKPSLFLTELDYQKNPLVRLVTVPAPQTVADGVVVGDQEQARQRLQQEAIRAVAEMRLSTAVQRLADLEKCRLLAAGADPGSFDPASFFSVPATSFDPGVTARTRPEPWLADDLRLSASALTTYEDCPLRFKFGTVLRVPTRPKTFFSLGTSLHAVCEQMGRRKMAGETVTLDAALAVLDAVWSSAGYPSRTKEEEDLARAREMVATYVAWEAANPNEVVDVERWFEFFIDGVRFVGSIDRLERTPEGRYVVVDYKSGGTTSITKKRLPENIQLNLYSLAVREIFGDLPERATFFFVREKKEWSYLPTEETVGAFRARVSADIEQIRAGAFPAVTGYGCSRCDYRMLCEGTEGEREW
ncbi:ATP-dependent helicase [Methanofollis formosanus]|nr:ATP-dependent DNA helicase [Methanofollis formosanus]